MKSKTSLCATLPALAAINLNIRGTWIRGVVIDDDFKTLPVAFTGRENDGPGILEHGHKVRNDDGLRVEVFRGAEQFWALPLPAALALVVIAAVTGPKGDVAVL